MGQYEEMINRNLLKLENGRIESNAQGEMIYANQSIVKLVKEYGTPLLIFDQMKIRENYRNMMHIFKKYYEKVEICFAYKSNSLLSVLRILEEEGAFADVVSEGELYKAELAGVDPSKIIVNGNNKSERELSLGVAKGALFQVDSLDELRLLIHVAEEQERIARVSMRVNPDISTGIIAEFSTALKKSKFGMDMEDGEALEAFRIAQQSEFCNVEGIHSHIGSQIEDSNFYKRSTEKILDFCGKLKKDLDLDLKYINMGGGFAIPFEYLDQVDDLEEFAKNIVPVLKEKVEEYGMKEPTILVEPGGSLVGNTAITLLTVGTIKQKENKKLAAVDAGGDLLLRATQGWYTYRVVCANKMNEKNNQMYDLVGPLCYEGDIIAHNRLLPMLEFGDIVAIIDTGAYVASLFNNYNGRLSPLVLMTNGETNGVTVIRKRDTVQDLVRNERCDKNNQNDNYYHICQEVQY